MKAKEMGWGFYVTDRNLAKMQVRLVEIGYFILCVHYYYYY